MRLRFPHPAALAVIGCALAFLSSNRAAVALTQDAENATDDGGTPKVLPRPDFKFKGKVGKTYKESDPPEFPQPVKAPEGCAERRADPAGRHGVRPVFDVRRRRPVADPGQARGGGAPVQPVPHHGLVQPDAGRADHRSQPPHGGDRRDHRGGHRVRRLHLRAAAELRHDRRGPPPERLHDRLDRQEPQHPRLGDERGGAVRPLGQRHRVRLFLRLQRRRHGPLGPDPLREPQPRPQERRPELSPDGRPGRQGDRLDAEGHEHRAGQAVLPLRRPGREPLAAPRCPRSGSTSSRASSTTAGTPIARRPSRGRRSSASSPRTPSSPSAARGCRRGTA